MKFRLQIICLASWLSTYGLNNATNETPLFEEALVLKADPTYELYDNNDDGTQAVLCSDYDSNDSDDDGISDRCEIEGYTVEKNKIVKWSDIRHQGKGFIKYKSDPYKKHTTGDPYTDSEKVLRNVDESILEEALHPLVAAFPEIRVNMEKIIISRNTTITDENGKSTGHQKTNTVSNDTTNNSSESSSISIKARTDFTSVSVSVDYSHTSSTSASVKKSSSGLENETLGQNWSNSLQMNTADSAFINGNVRYVNIGTAPIYQVKPTINFVLGKDKESQTLATITAKNNTVANFILPGESYPNTNHMPIALNAIDDFNSQPIKINYYQLLELAKKTPLQIQTTQTTGLFKKYSLDRDTQITDAQKWDYIMPEIYKRTAGITLDLKNQETKRRYVAARESKNYNNQSQPELSLKQAIELAFPKITVDSERNQILFPSASRKKLEIIIDQNTSNEIDQQIKETKISSFFNAKLIQGMNILIRETDNDNSNLSDQELLDEVKWFLESFNESSPFTLQGASYDQDWKSILPLIHNQIEDKFGFNNAQKINDIWFSNSAAQRIDYGADASGKSWKQIRFSIGNNWSPNITIYFKNIYTDQFFSDKIANFFTKNQVHIALYNKDATFNDIIPLIQDALRKEFGSKLTNRIKNINFGQLNKIAVKDFGSRKEFEESTAKIEFQVGTSIKSDINVKYFFQFNNKN